MNEGPRDDSEQAFWDACFINVLSGVLGTDYAQNEYVLERARYIADYALECRRKRRAEG